MDCLGGVCNAFVYRFAKIQIILLFHALRWRNVLRWGVRLEGSERVGGSQRSQSPQSSRSFSEVSEFSESSDPQKRAEREFDIRITQEFDFCL